MRRCHGRFKILGQKDGGSAADSSLRALAAGVAAPEAQSHPASESKDLSGDPSRAVRVCVVEDQGLPSDACSRPFIAFGAFPESSICTYLSAPKALARCPGAGRRRWGPGIRATASLRVLVVAFS